MKVQKLDLSFESYEEPKVIGRISELSQLRRFIKTSIVDKKGGYFYICGNTGTGKTEVANQVFHGINTWMSINSISALRLLWIEGSRGLIEIPKCLNIKKKKSEINSLFEKPNPLTLLVIDEIDLLNKKEYKKVIEMANAPNSRLILVGISNIEQPGLFFRGYTDLELEAIVKSKLSKEILEKFHPVAIKMCMKKAAKLSGDVRKALENCQRVFQIYSAELTLITAADVNRGLAECSFKSKIQNLSAQCKFALVAVDGQVGLDEIRKKWTKLREVWGIPIDGDVFLQLEQLMDAGILDREFKLLPSSDEILAGLLANDQDPEWAMEHKPIIKAFRGILPPRQFANMHKVH